MRDAGHTLAASHWAVHEAVRAGRLQAGQMEVELPSYGSFGGGRGTVSIPQGRPTPFDSFKVTATDSLWVSWHSSVDQARDQSEPAEPASDSSTPKKAKRSTERGEGQAKLIAALTNYHKYADRGCLNQEPVGNNELARLAGVDQATASLFFKQQFKGHGTYKKKCADAVLLVTALKLLNDDFAPHLLYGNKPADEDERDEE